MYPLPMKDNVIPGSDGAGEIVAVGPISHSATSWKVGDRVAGNFTQLHISGQSISDYNEKVLSAISTFRLHFLEQRFRLACNSRLTPLALDSI